MGPASTAPSLLPIRAVDELRAAVWKARLAGQRIALVPTMGYLHGGHLSLVRLAGEHADIVVVSIFVNPTQFGPTEDFAAYPRDLPADIEKLARAGADLVFVPDESVMYPDGFVTSVRVAKLTEHLCGVSRPVHFEGVATIVTKLFNLVTPDLAIFGEKDYQQLVVLRRLVRDLDFAIEIVGAPTVREPDGLAMSSRNAYLTPSERAAAPSLYRALTALREGFGSGERDAATLRALGLSLLESQAPLRVDYLELFDPDDLHLLPEPGESQLPARVHAAVAVYAGRARLIDNLRLSE